MSRMMEPWPGLEVDALKGDVKDMAGLRVFLEHLCSGRT